MSLCNKYKQNRRVNINNGAIQSIFDKEGQTILKEYLNL